MELKGAGMNTNILFIMKRIKTIRKLTIKAITWFSVRDEANNPIPTYIPHINISPMYALIIEPISSGPKNFRLTTYTNVGKNVMAASDKVD